MDKTDLFLWVLSIVGALVLGALVGYGGAKQQVYQACETRQPLVIEMGGVKQVYACLKVQR